jgi:inhibitor of KinA
VINPERRYPRVLAAGDAALTVEFGETIDPILNERVLAFATAVETLAIPGLLEVVPTYRSATVYVDPVVVDVDGLIGRLQALAHGLPHSPSPAGRCLEIPVLYGGDAGPDLAHVSAFAHRSAPEVIALHASVKYRVYMLGFSPGFPYMGRVPEPIAMPRLPTPRIKVPAGSVGIAGFQTGIYPIESPGGWRLIGRTPLRLYDPDRPAPFLLQPGDQARFVPISQPDYDRLAGHQDAP